MTNAGDGYAELGEFHDLFMEAPWERLRPILAAEFAGLDSDALLVDIGAGTGVGTRVLASVTPARILAVEPSLTMRAVLTARVADDAGLARRVSVIDTPAPAVFDVVDEPIAGFVCAHMLGHLGADARRQLLAGLVERLSPEGRGIVTADRDAVEPSEVIEESRTIGGFRYVARHLPSDAAGYVSEYEVWRGSERLRSARFAGSWSPVSASALAVEAEACGLAARVVADGVLVLSRQV